MNGVVGVEAPPRQRLGQPPSLRRRLAAFTYEGVLLFGVVMVAGLLYGALTNQRHALVGQRGLQVFIFLVLALYFIGFWVRQGQTLAMRTWHIRLVTAQGQPLTLGRASARYLLSWLWFLPALALLQASGLQGGWHFSGALLTGVLAYAAISRLHPGRQFLHDALCGTRLVDERPGDPSGPAADNPRP